MVKIKAYTKQPLTHIGGNAAFCYGMEDKVKRFSKIAQRCLKENHGRVLEFADIELLLSGKSAKVFRELYTHQHTSKLQSSTRYVNYGDGEQFEYETPPSVLNNSEANKIFSEHMKDTHKRINKLIELGIPIEDATNVLPLAYSSKVVYKINLRTLIHMFGVRSCACAYLEFRVLMIEIKKAIKELKDDEWDYLADNYFVPKCKLLLYCEEETRCCGLAPKKSEVMKMISESKEKHEQNKS